MKKKVRPYFSGFIALSLLALLVLVIIHYKGGVGLEVTFTEDGDIGVKIENIHYSSTREGRVAWEFDALSATRFKKKDLMVFVDIRAVFYAKDGTPYRLKANRGSYNEAGGEIKAMGDVVITSPDGYSLKTESVKYETDPGEITSPDHVFISSEGMDVEGVGLRMKIDGGSLYIFKDVRAVLKDRAI